MALKDVEITPNLQETVKPQGDLSININSFQKVEFKRSEEEKKAWETIQSILKSDYLLTSDGTPAGELSKLALRIEKDFSFIAQERDDDFSSFHIEPLLDQAADLLDRGLKDRETWDEQATKMFLLALELNEYKELDEIHQLEEANGIYDVNWKQSGAEYRAEETSSRWQSGLKSFVDNMLSNFYSGEAFNKQYNAARKASWLVGIVYYLFQGQTFSEYVKHKWGDSEKEASAFAIEAAEAQSEYSLNVQRESLALQQGVHNANSEVSKERLPGLEARSNWDILNANFLRRRTTVARNYQDIKSKAATDPDGILNYGKRLDSLKKRFHQDFRDALARLKAVQIGLRDIYGYDAPLPADESSIDYFDECLLWSRQAIQWLIRFSRAEQSFILPVSLRGIVGDNAWHDNCKSGIWEINLSEDFFIDLTHVRLRGLSASFIGSFAERRLCAEKKLWQVAIKVPPIGQINHITGNKVELDQSKIPPCRLARVTDRNSPRDPDIAGMSALFNVSPIGKWTIQVLGSVPKSSNFSEIHDIQLDLHLAFRSKI